MESTESLWVAETGRELFRATMSLENLHIIFRIIHFDNLEADQLFSTETSLLPLGQCETRGRIASPCLTILGLMTPLMSS